MVRDMEKTRIRIDKNAINPVYLPAFNNKKLYKIFYGGAGSGKSVSIAQMLILSIMSSRNAGRKILIVRKVGNSIKDSVFSEIVYWIRKWGLYPEFDIPSGKAGFDITCHNGNMFIFKGLDDVEKIKSIQGLEKIWIEEASEITENDWKQLNLRIRGVENKQFILSFNPISDRLWLKKYFFDEPSEFVKNNSYILKTTYKDNRFLTQSDIDVIEDNKNDPVFYAIYAQGNWGVIGNLVFPSSSYKIEKCPKQATFYDVIYYGVDFGFNHPSAFVKGGIKFNDNGIIDIYAIDNLEIRYKTNEEFAKIIIPRMSENGIIYMESAEPDRIKEFREKFGISVRPVTKYKGSVLASINFLKQNRLHIDPGCQDLVNEITTYKWKIDRFSGEAMDEPVDMHDDSLDALRYMTWGIMKNGPATNKVRRIRFGNNSYWGRRRYIC